MEGWVLDFAVAVGREVLFDCVLAAQVLDY